MAMATDMCHFGQKVDKMHMQRTESSTYSKETTYTWHLRGY